MLTGGLATNASCSMAFFVGAQGVPQGHGMSFPFFTYILYGVMWRMWFPASIAWTTQEEPHQSEDER